MEKVDINHEEENFMRSTVAVTPPFEVGEGAIDASEMDDASAQEYAETLANSYLIKVDPLAPGCCIDGRGCRYCRAGTQTVPGPKCAGGPLITAYAAARLTGWFESNDPDTHENALAIVAEQLTDAKIVLGGHVDTAAEKQGFVEKTGCGANDKLPKIIENIAKYAEPVTGATELTYGYTADTYKPERARAVVEEAVKPVKGWEPQTTLDLLGQDKTEVLDHEEDPTGGHHEVMVVLNFIEGTTIDRDRLIKDGNPQVFVVDVWYIEKLARAMARGPEAEAQYEALKHAMIAYQVSTYITLGNGRHRFAVIQEESLVEA